MSATIIILPMLDPAHYNAALKGGAWPERPVPGTRPMLIVDNARPKPRPRALPSVFLPADLAARMGAALPRPPA